MIFGDTTWAQLREKQRLFEQQYYRDHEVCPKCGSDWVVTTLVGYIPDPAHLDRFKDGNAAVCQGCHWEGTVHQLVKEKT